VQYWRCNLLIFLITLIHFCVYLNLTFSCDLVYKIKSLIIFFRISNNAIIYLLMLSYSIVAFNNNLSNNLFNILLNFFKFITFQFCLKRRIDFVCVLRFNIVLINKWFDELFIFLFMSQYINRFVVSFVTNNKSIMIRVF